MLDHVRYRPDIDGLRAVAVLAVLFYHADLGLPGGFVGVDVFFVISGYLITKLILKNTREGNFSIFEFWERRIRRIFPALAVVVFCCCAVAWILLIPRDFKDFGGSVAAQMLFISNFYFWWHSGYFDQNAEYFPLLHTWSLAVEEQFYFFYPFLLVALRSFPPRTLVAMLLILILASFGVSLAEARACPVANFYLLPSRTWELLIGALPAAVAHREKEPALVREGASWLGLAGILYAFFFYTKETPFPGAAALPPCAGAALLIWSNGTGPTWVGRLLSLRPVVFIGLISYSLYLWHWPFLVFARYLSPLQGPKAPRIILLMISAVFAVLSWKFIETPFRSRSLLKTRFQIFFSGGLVAVFLLAAGLFFYGQDGASWRFPAAALAYAQGSDDTGYRAASSLADVQNGSFKILGDPDNPAPPRFLLWGDSHAMATVSALDALSKEHHFRGLAAVHAGVPPVLGLAIGPDSVTRNEAIFAYLRDHRIPNVLLVGRWDVYSESLVRLRDTLHQTIAQLDGLGVHVYILREVPRPSVDVPRFLALSVMLRLGEPEKFQPPELSYRKDIARQNFIFEGVRPEDATFLDPTPLLIRPDGHIRIAANGQALYFDDNHLSVAGAMYLRPLFEAMFARF